MSASRRGAATRSQQSTISFGSKSRVIKPSVTSPPAKKATETEPVADSVSVEVVINQTQRSPARTAPPSWSSQPPTADLVVRAQAKAEVEQPLTKEDKRAVKITDADLKRYWMLEEEKRHAPQGCSL
jgi:DNA polymerase delta subunit 4